MKRNIYISCEKNRKEFYKKLVEKNSQNITVVNDLNCADICLVMGVQDELMGEEIINAEQDDIEIKAIDETLIQTGIYKSMLSGIGKPKVQKKSRVKEL